MDTCATGKAVRDCPESYFRNVAASVDRNFAGMAQMMKMTHETLPGFPELIQVNLFPRNPLHRAMLEDVSSRADLRADESVHGSIGSVRFSIAAVNDRPALFVEEVQPSWGFKNIGGLMKKGFERWHEPVPYLALSIAAEAGLGLVIANTSQNIKNRYPAAEWDDLNTHYNVLFHGLYEKHQINYRNIFRTDEDVRRMRGFELQAKGRELGLMGGSGQMWCYDLEQCGTLPRMKEVKRVIRYSSRDEMLTEVGDHIALAQEQKLAALGKGRLLVGFEGFDGSGKTTFINRELMPYLIAVLRKDVIGADGDWSIPSKQTRDEEFEKYRDYFQWFRYGTIFGPILKEIIETQGDSIKREGLYNRKTGVCDVDIDLKVGDNTIVLVDGLFLQLPEVRQYLDLLFHFRITEAQSRMRQIRRDIIEKGRTREEVEDLVDNVFIKAHRKYHKDHRPLVNSDFVIDNTMGGR